MVTATIKNGQKFYDPLNKSFNYFLKNAFASGKSILVGTNPMTGQVTTVIRSSKNLIKSRIYINTVIMISAKEVLEILQQILDQKDTKELIKSFQTKIWSDELVDDDYLSEILTELAYDLDFYEPDIVLRKEDGSFYDNKRLKEIINNGIGKINGHIKRRITFLSISSL